MRKLGDNGILARMAIFMAIALLSLTPTTKAFVCPNATEVYPCYCYRSIGDGSFNAYCQGPDATQVALDRLLAAIRRENTNLTVNTFTLKETTLTELDLTPFEGGVFKQMDFINNRLLSKVVGPNIKSKNWNPITTLGLDWSVNNFQDAGLQTMLSYFTRAEIINLDFTSNKLRGTLGQEFLPGFSELSSIEILYLNENNIRILGGGQFRGMSNLVNFVLLSNELLEIGEEAFAMDGTGILSVFLGGNNLTDESFHPNSGIANNRNRKMYMYFHDNHFQRVREDRFLKFLELNPDNSLDFTGNPIWCDSDMKWLKDRCGEFQERVRGLHCVNDPGKTVFTTYKIEGDCEISNGNSFRLSLEVLLSLFCLLLTSSA